MPNEKTNNPGFADRRNLYKIEKWTKDGSAIDSMLWAGSSLDKARQIFTAAVSHRPRVRLTIWQRTRVIEQHPNDATAG